MGSSNKAQREAQAAEAQRAAQVAATQRQVEGVYSDPRRETDIQDLIAATRSFLTRDLNEKNSDAARQLKFANARTGNTLGSVDADRKQRLGQDYLKAALEVERRAQASGTALRQADQQSKLQLFSMAQQGLDMTTAARQAGEAMRVNLANSKADALQNGIGDAFSSLGDVYKASKTRAGEQKAEHYQYGSFYSPTPGGGFG